TENTPPAPNQPRPPNRDELAQLADWLLTVGFVNREDAELTATAAFVAVYDDYCTGGPGYCGQVMSVVWDGGPTFFDVFACERGKMVRSGRDYDERECYRCGGKNGTLCSTCWWRWSQALHQPKAQSHSQTMGETVGTETEDVARLI